MMRMLPVALMAAGLFLFSAACKRSQPANVAAVVNGRAITYAELNKEFQSQFPSASAHADDDQTQFQKLELLRAMIDKQIMVQRAEKANLMATDADVEAKLNELPQFTTTVEVGGFGGLGIHFLHYKSSRPDALPLLFCHGCWCHPPIVSSAGY